MFSGNPANLTKTLVTLILFHNTYAVLNIEIGCPKNIQKIQNFKKYFLTTLLTNIFCLAF